MIGVNLIPPAILEAHRRARRIRLWIVAVALTAGAAALPVLWQVRQHARVAELTTLKQARAAETAAVRAELSAAAQSLADLNDRIERADALRTKRSWAGLLSLLAQCLPQEVWLTSVATDAPPPAAAGRRTSPTPSGKQDQPKVVVLDGAGRATLAGYAVGHEQLYDFMARLKAAQAFDRIDLVKADKEEVLWSRAVRFELVCTW